MFEFDFKALLSPERVALLLRLATLVLIGFPTVLLLSRWVRNYSTGRFSKQQSMVSAKVVLYGGIVIVVVSILNELGFKISHLLAAAGVVGIAIGFAAQTSFSNIISGLFLITEQSFVIGDIIMVGGTKGEVLSIDTLAIKLRTFDNKLVRIPNEVILKNDLTNLTRFPVRRVDLNLSVAYKEDIERVREILIDVTHKNPLCLQEPAPVFIFEGFGSSSIDLFLGVWAATPDFLKLKNSIQMEIKKRFEEEGIEIPFPHLSLYKGTVSEPFPVVVTKTPAEPPRD